MMVASNIPVLLPEEARLQTCHIQSRLREHASRELQSVHFENAHLTVELPEDVVQILLSVLDHLASGKALYIMPADSQLTTQQAADFLGVSRKHLVETLLDTGKIPCIKAGSHRRIKFQDLISYEQQQHPIREQALQSVFDMNQELGLMP
jgi:excisionase family DNA binding protein